MNDRSGARDERSTQLRHTLYWGAGTVAAAVALWQLGDPWLIEHFGSGAPWWAYLLLCMKFAGGIIQMIVDDAALRRAAGEQTAAPGAMDAPEPLASVWPNGGVVLSSDTVGRDFEVTSGSGLSHGR